MNGLANSILILDENRPIHLIHLNLQKDPFSLIYSGPISFDILTHPDKKQQSWPPGSAVPVPIGLMVVFVRTELNPYG